MRKVFPLLAALGLSLGAAACTGTTAKAPAPAKAESTGEALSAPKAVADAQRALNALGYEAGPADGRAGSNTDKALRAYQKDEKLPVDGRLTVALHERLKAQRAKLPGRSWSVSELGLSVVYGEGPAETLESVDKTLLTWRTSDGARLQRPANFLLGANADASSNFLQPLTPGAKGQYRLQHRDGAAETAVTVTCTVGRLGRTAVPAGAFDTIEAVCREESNPAIERHYAYAPELRLVIRDEIRRDAEEPRIRELVALRPPTESWPRAAQVGLDWALTHALDDPAQAEPVRWSSTGVKERFAIRVDRAAPIAIPTGSGGSGRCLRYEIERTDGEAPHKRYPGLACKSEKGPWMIPSPSPTLIAHPSVGLSPQAAADAPAAKAER